MTEYLLGKEVIVIPIHPDFPIEISFSGRMKWQVRRSYNNTILAQGFLNCSTYVIKSIDPECSVELVAESFEKDLDEVSFYVRTLWT